MNEFDSDNLPQWDQQTPAEIMMPRGVAAGRGAAWISEGFAMFKQNPLTWIALVILMFVIHIILALIPFIGQIAGSIIWPVFTAGVMTGCLALDDGKELTIGHLFAGFQTKTGSLLGLGALNFGVVIVVVVLMVLIAALMGFGLAGFVNGEVVTPDNEAAALSGLLLIALVGGAIFMPVVMAFWFAPVLIMLMDQGIVESLKLSFSGCLRNIMPFLIYGIIATVLLVLATIPAGLGLLVVVPVLMASLFKSYKDIYGVN